MTKIIGNMLNNFDIDKSVAYVKDWVKQNTKWQEHRLRWLTKFDKLTKMQREKLVHKIVDKYKSDSYKEREYKKSYEPRCYLYDWLFEYGMECGEPFEYMQNGNFPEEQYLIDDHILVGKMYGQGDFIYVKFLDKEHGKRWLRGDFHDALQKFLQKWGEKLHGKYTIEGNFKLESYQHDHLNGHVEKFTVDVFDFDIKEPKISHD